MRSERALRAWALVLFAVVVGLDIGYILLSRGIDHQPPLDDPAALDRGEVVGIITPAMVGLVLTWLRPRNPIGWLISFPALCLGLCDFGSEYAARAAVFPDENLPLSHWVLALTAPLWIPALFTPVTFLLVRYPTGRIEGRWALWFDRSARLGMLAVYLGYAFSDNAISDQIKGGKAVIDFPDILGPLVALPAFVLALIGIAGIVVDAGVRAFRSPRPERMALLWLLVWAVLAVVLVMWASEAWIGSLAYFGVMVAIAVGVLRYATLGIEVVQALIDKLLFGDRDVHGALLLPAGGDEGVPLLYEGTELGRLTVPPRRGEVHLTRPDQRLLEAVAPLVAAVLHAERERDRVVEATQAERKRLRQELHDGLGPSLTGIGLGLEAAQRSGATDELLGRLRTEVASSLEEVRRIIDDLRPSALDDQDLLSALRKRADQVTTTGVVSVAFDAPDSLPELPPTVAAAAFRIADEALANVVRHASARHCVVQLRVDDQLRLEVSDDGVGPGDGREGGVGLVSMRERAERIGGRFTLKSTDPGTSVLAELPLAVGP